MKTNDTMDYITQSFKPSCPTRIFLEKAAKYLGKNLDENWSKKDLRKLNVKVKKMKKSETKLERHKVHQLKKEMHGY